jgi:hypothetical protein
MAELLDLSKTFVHLKRDGNLETVALTPNFWGASTRGGYDQLVGWLKALRCAGLHHPQRRARSPVARAVVSRKLRLLR